MNRGCERSGGDRSHPFFTEQRLSKTLLFQGLSSKIETNKTGERAQGGLMTFDQIIIIDLGSQTNQLISRRIRDFGVYSELKDPSITADELKKIEGLKGIILSGGPNSVNDEGLIEIDESIFDLGIPILGICYGMQWITKHFGGVVEPCEKREYGSTRLKIKRPSLLFQDIPAESIVWMSHKEHVTKIPEKFDVIAASASCPFAAFSHQEKKIYGVQFHPEVRNTVFGQDLLKNFLFAVCEAKKNWTMENYIDREVERIRKTVGKSEVILGLSGGVDSSVAASLIDKAIGKQLTCIFVDHGLLRQNEADKVMSVYADHFQLNVIKIDAKKTFLEALKGITDPEDKRKAIGKTFIDVFEEATKERPNATFLAQGTLYTDRIESGTKTAHTIKSHHNVGGLPARMRLKLIEPLSMLFKDEVRELGLRLGLPKDVVSRQPFPGPGLAIRIIGAVTEEKLKIVSASDAILHEEIERAGLKEHIWQYFTVLTPVKTVGVMGDQRTYDHVLVIRAVTSIDGMTADWAHIPYDVLSLLSTRMINEIEGINRVVYDITSKPPGTIEWE